MTAGEPIAKHSESSGRFATMDNIAVSAALGPSIASMVGNRPRITPAVAMFRLDVLGGVAQDASDQGCCFGRVRTGVVEELVTWVIIGRIG